MNEATSIDSHFKDKDAIAHVIEKRADGVIALSEAHGMEIPGHISAAADAMRESALALMLIWTLASGLNFTFNQCLILILGFGTAWTLWKTGRSAWLAWSRLERLHRVIEEERFEIENNREQEREELTALYRAKGFEGALLESVIDVLMADGDRLLKVMLEEELGLTLEAHEHPLKQAIGAFIGSLLSFAIILAVLFLSPLYGIIIASMSLIGLGGAISAKFENNKMISAIIWNVSIAVFSLGFMFFITKMIYGSGQ